MSWKDVFGKGPKKQPGQKIGRAKKGKYRPKDTVENRAISREEQQSLDAMIAYNNRLHEMQQLQNARNKGRGNQQ